MVLVLSLGTDKIGCRWCRSSLEMIMLAARMLSRNGGRGVSRDFAGPHRKSWSAAAKGRRLFVDEARREVYSMMSLVSWRSFQDKGDDSTPPYHRP